MADACLCGGSGSYHGAVYHSSGVEKSKDAISERSSRGRISKKKPLWEKCFIDVILLALSAYLLYNYNKQKSTLAISVLENRSIDPVMILDNSLFIFAAALLCVRLTGLIILLVDRLFKSIFSGNVCIIFTAKTNQIQSGISGSISYHDSGWRYF